MLAVCLVGTSTLVVEGESLGMGCGLPELALVGGCGSRASRAGSKRGCTEAETEAEKLYDINIVTRL